ncbi:sensor histidine kinase YesM [Rivibacter subsaxonicus]|uniref:Sensor histidine kinase YesM n=2 Tax=Rivibacter subsaxonicus TaxID=457575 RepID=A0A4Q7W1G2_9BURK|nr:sensor histidine kinase YesM [Rivibacter subsaxonicus]
MTATDPNNPQADGRWWAGLGWRRVGTVLLLATLVAAALNPIFVSSFLNLWLRVAAVALVLMLGFTLAGNWQQNMVPRWLAQTLAVALLAPLGAFFVATVAAGWNPAEVVRNEARLTGFVLVAGSGLFLGLVLTLGALVREREAQARTQALRFQLERETLERQALDTQLRLMHAQIEPHFLFNTLANVQALVETGSPRAAPVLQSLIDYLRAAVPRLRESRGTLEAEMALVRAYLQLMELRMPDRLGSAIRLPASLAALHFPPMALLTLVENAVRHGIDPSESGGRIEVGASAKDDGGVCIWVEDSGVGLDETAPAGFGLTNLRERLAAFYGPSARLELGTGADGHGLRAEIHLPAALVQSATAP